MRYICEILGIRQFSSFSTSARSRHSAQPCPRVSTTPESRHFCCLRQSPLQASAEIGKNIAFVHLFTKKMRLPPTRGQCPLETTRLYPAARSACGVVPIFFAGRRLYVSAKPPGGRLFRIAETESTKQAERHSALVQLFHQVIRLAQIAGGFRGHKFRPSRYQQVPCFDSSECALAGAD